MRNSIKYTVLFIVFLALAAIPTLAQGNNTWQRVEERNDGTILYRWGENTSMFGVCFQTQCVQYDFGHEGYRFIDPASGAIYLAQAKMLDGTRIVVSFVYTDKLTGQLVSEVFVFDTKSRGRQTVPLQDQNLHYCSIVSADDTVPEIVLSCSQIINGQETNGQWQANFGSTESWYITDYVPPIPGR